MKEFDVFYYISPKFFHRYKRPVLLFMIVVISVTFVWCSLTPSTYISSVRLIFSQANAPKVSSSIARILGISSMMGSSYSQDIIISILKSRRMAKDIQEKFNPGKKRSFFYSLDAYDVIGGLAIDVKGRYPELTKDMANFAVDNLDKINTELDITVEKPMVKVLDPAESGVKEPRNILFKVLIAGIMSFFMAVSYIFTRGEMKRLRSVFGKGN